jgi:hypothetical protein
VVFGQAVDPLTRRQTVLIALGAALVLALSVASSAAISYLHFQRLVGEERLAAERAERANTALQDALSRMRDELATAQLHIDTLTGELTKAQERMRAVEDWRRQVAAYQDAQTRRPVSDRRGSAPAGKPQDAAVAPVANPPAAAEQAAPVTGSSPVAAASGEVKNFTAPGWVPSYFSSESAPFLGSGKQ